MKNPIKILYKGLRNKELKISGSLNFNKTQRWIENNEIVEKPVWAELHLKHQCTTYYFGMWGQRRFWLISKEEFFKLQKFLKDFSSVDKEYFKIKYHTDKESLNIKDPLNPNMITDKLDDIFEEYVVLEEKVDFHKAFVENGVYIYIVYATGELIQSIHLAPFKGKSSNGITYIQVLINQDKKEKLSEDNVLFFENTQSVE